MAIPVNPTWKSKDEADEESAMPDLDEIEMPDLAGKRRPGERYPAQNPAQNQTQRRQPHDTQTTDRQIRRNPPAVSEVSENFESQSRPQSNTNRRQQPRTRTDETVNNRQRAQPTRGRATPSAVPPESDANTDNEGWETDPKTGKRYKTLAATPKEAIAAYKKAGGQVSYRDLAKYVTSDDDFDLDDLDGAANTFLAHLRVPPDKKEMERLRQEKIKRTKKQQDTFDNIQNTLTDKYGDDDLANG